MHNSLTCLDMSTKQPSGMEVELPIDKLLVTVCNLSKEEAVPSFIVVIQCGMVLSHVQSLIELSLEEKLSECMELVKPILSHIPIVLVSLGSDGVLYCSTQRDKQVHAECLYYPAAASHMLPASVLSVSGAGDRCVLLE